MVFSKATEYALKSLTYMARYPDQDIFGVKELSGRLGVSKSYLSKTLQALVGKGILVSTTGPRGGFGLGKAPEKIRLYDLIESCDDTRAFEDCYFGWSACSDRDPCPMHHSWKSFKSELKKSLQQTSIADAAAGAWPRLLKRP